MTIEEQAKEYADNIWGDSYKLILSDEVINKGKLAYQAAFLAGAKTASNTAVIEVLNNEMDRLGS